MARVMTLCAVANPSHAVDGPVGWARVHGGKGGEEEVELFTYHGLLCLHRSLVDTRKIAHSRYCRCAGLSNVKGIALMLSKNDDPLHRFLLFSYFISQFAGSKRLVDQLRICQV